MPAVIDDITAYMKDLYEDEVPTIGFKKNKAWAIIKKSTNFRGRAKEFAVTYGAVPGVSHTFSDAQSNAGAEPNDYFNVTRSKDYVLMSIDGEAFEAADGEGAKVAFIKRHVEMARKTAAWRLNRSFYRHRGGRIAQLLAAGAGGGTSTITVQNPLDLLLLSRNMVIVSAGDDGLAGGGVDANPGTIQSIDRSAGTITRTSGNWNAAGGFSDGDFIFIEGDYGNDFFGLEEWVPTADPGTGDVPAALFGLTRTNDELRLSGHRIAATAEDGTLENFFDRATTEVSVQGGAMKMCLLTHPNHVAQLRRELGNKVEYNKVPAQTSEGPHAEIGFKSIALCTDGEDVEILGDRDCPLHGGWLLDLEQCSWEGLGEAPRILEYGGGNWLREGSNDAIEGRMGARGQFVVHAPGHCAYLDLSALTDPDA